MTQPMKGQIYYCALDEGAVGYEMNKLRPVVIVQNDVGNYQKPTTIIAPITSKRATRYFSSHVNLSPEIQRIDEGFKEVTGTVCTEQIRTVDKRRLKSLIGCLNREGVVMLNKAMVAILDLNAEIHASEEDEYIKQEKKEA